jgi:hypothetical protein
MCLSKKDGIVPWDGVLGRFFELYIEMYKNVQHAPFPRRL